MLSKAVLAFGNSSSFLIEAPSVKTPSLIIGERQRGRLRGQSVFSCTFDVDQIINNIKIIQEKETICFDNPYDTVSGSVKINFVNSINRYNSLYSRETIFHKKLVRR